MVSESSLIQKILDTFPGSCVVGAVERPRAPAAELPKAQKSKSPYVLVKDINNYHVRSWTDQKLFYGIYDDEQMLRDFRDMKNRVSGQKLMFTKIEKQPDGSEKGIDKVIEVASRWNSEYDYGRKVWRQFMDEVKGLKVQCMLTLTVKPELVSNVMPGWWVYGERAWMIKMGNKYVTTFLKRLERYKRRNDEPWNYIGYVMEFHNSGFVHYHILFYGSWVGKIDYLHKIWGLSDRNGIHVRKGSGTGAVQYMTAYINKNLDEIRSTKDEKLYMWLWYNKVRLFNTRHYRKTKKGTETKQIPGEVMTCEYKWKCVGFAMPDGRVRRFSRFDNSPPKQDKHWTDYDDD